MRRSGKCGALDLQKLTHGFRTSGLGLMPPLALFFTDATILLICILKRITILCVSFREALVSTVQ